MLAAALAVCPVAVCDTLPEAVVTAASPAGGVRAGTAVYVLDSLALRTRAVTSTADALRRMPGVLVRDYGGAGGMKTVSVRGMGSQHTVLTYDGLPVAAAETGQGDLALFDLRHLGGVSLYTLDAPALLVPPRTLSLATLDLTPAAPRREAAFAVGSFGHVAPLLSAVLPTGGGTALGLSADFQSTRGDYPFTIVGDPQRTTYHRSNSRRTATTMHATWESAAPAHTPQGHLAATAFFTHQHQHLPGPVVFYVEGNAERLLTTRAFASAQWRHTRGAWQWMAAAKYDYAASRYTDRDGQYPGGMRREAYTQHEAYAVWGAAWRQRAWALAYAADYTATWLHSDQRAYDGTVRHGLLQSLSAVYDAGRLRLTARGVLHYASTTHEQRQQQWRFTPSVTANCRISSQAAARSGHLFALRLAAKSYFRLPSFAEAYRTHLGSATLRPEAVQQIVAGATLLTHGAWLSRLSVSVDIYAGRVTDRIVSVPYDLRVWRTINMGQTRQSGLDFALEGVVQPAARHRLTLAMTYAYISLTDRSDAASRSYGQTLAYTPRHSGSVALSWQSPWLCCAAALTAVGSRWSTHEHVEGTLMPRYAEASLALSRDVRLSRLSLALRLDVTNLLAARYEVVRRYPMPGRAVIGTVSLKW